MSPHHPNTPPHGDWPVESSTAETPQIPHQWSPQQQEQHQYWDTPSQAGYESAPAPSPSPEPTGTIRRKHVYTGHITRKRVAATIIAIIAVAVFVAAVLWALTWLRDKSEKDKYNDYGATTSQVTTNAATGADTQRRTPTADC